MAKVVITKWCCDRCGTTLDEPPALGGVEKMTVKVTQHGDWAERLSQMGMAYAFRLSLSDGSLGVTQ